MSGTSSFHHFIASILMGCLSRKFTPCYVTNFPMWAWKATSSLVFFLPSLGKFSSYTIIVTKMIFKQNSTREGVYIGLREKVPTELWGEWNFSLLWSLLPLSKTKGGCTHSGAGISSPQLWGSLCTAVGGYMRARFLLNVRRSVPLLRRMYGG